MGFELAVDLNLIYIGSQLESNKKAMNIQVFFLQDLGFMCFVNLILFCYLFMHFCPYLFIYFFFKKRRNYELVGTLSFHNRQGCQEHFFFLVGCGVLKFDMYCAYMSSLRVICYFNCFPGLYVF